MASINDSRDNPNYRDYNTVPPENAEVLLRLKPEEILTTDKTGKLGTRVVTRSTSSHARKLPKPERAELELAACLGVKRLVEKVPIENLKDIQKISQIVSNLCDRGVIHNRAAAERLVEETLVSRPDVHAFTSQHISKYTQIQTQILEESKSTANPLTEFTAAVVTANRMLHDPDVPPYYKELIRPNPVEEGTSGVYFVKNILGEVIGVFKPTDEQPYMPHNPKGRTPKTLPKDFKELYQGFPMEKSSERELASYITSEQLFPGFALETARISLQCPRDYEKPKTPTVLKEGSLQAFGKGTPSIALEDRTELMKIETPDGVPTAEMQKLALLDLVIGNNDRNEGNYLYSRESKRIVPIDHNMAFGTDFVPSKTNPTPSMSLVTPCSYEEQMFVPVEQDVLRDFDSFDIEKTIGALREQGISEEQIAGMKARYDLTKIALRKGYNLNQIQRMFTAFGRNNGIIGAIQNVMLYEKALEERSQPIEKSVFELFDEKDPESLDALWYDNGEAGELLEKRPYIPKDLTGFYSELAVNFTRVLDALDHKSYLT